jgi:hypothetical protein
LSSFVAVLALIAALIGLLRQGAGESFSFTTLRGDEVEIYGRGLYRNEWAFKAPILRGGDAIILFLGIPFLVFAILLTRRGSLRGRFLLTGVLSCFLYNASSLALGAVYNPLFLLYVAYFSASLYAFVLAFSSIDLEALPARISPGLPRRVMAIFIMVSGLSTSVWLIDIIAALAEGGTPANLAHYTTDVTAVIDIGIILPAAFLAGILLLRRKPLAYPLTTTLLTLLSLIGLIVAGQTVMQMVDGIVLSPGEFAVFVVPFVALSLVADGLLVVFLRRIRGTAV